MALLSIPFGWQALTASQAALLVSAGICGGIAQILMTEAYRHAEASTVAPFEYTSMILAHRRRLSRLRRHADHPHARRRRDRDRRRHLHHLARAAARHRAARPRKDGVAAAIGVSASGLAPARLPQAPRRSPRRPGKNDSIASSDSVTSSGVPNTVIVLMKDRTSSPTRSLQRVRDRGKVRMLRPAASAAPAGIGPQLALEVGEHRVGDRVVLALQPLDQMARHSARLTMRGASPCGCRLSRSTLTGGCKQRRIGDVGKQRRDRRVGGDQVPVAVDRDGRVRLMALEHQPDRFHRRLRATDRRAGARRSPARSRRRAAGGCAPGAGCRAGRRDAAPCRATVWRGRFRGSSDGAARSRPRWRGRAGSCAGGCAIRAAMHRQDVSVISHAPDDRRAAEITSITSRVIARPAPTRPSSIHAGSSGRPQPRGNRHVCHPQPRSFARFSSSTPLVSGAAGLLMAAGAPYPVAAARPAGGPAVLGRRRAVPVRRACWSSSRARGEASRLVLIDIIAINALWVAASFGLLVSGAVAPNAARLCLRHRAGAGGRAARRAAVRRHAPRRDGETAA